MKRNDEIVSSDGQWRVVRRYGQGTRRNIDTLYYVEGPGAIGDQRVWSNDHDALIWRAALALGYKAGQAAAGLDADAARKIGEGLNSIIDNLQEWAPRTIRHHCMGLQSILAEAATVAGQVNASQLDELRLAVADALGFMAGFEDDETQEEPVAPMMDRLRRAREILDQLAQLGGLS